jgi:hypothetical protein
MGDRLSDEELAKLLSNARQNGGQVKRWLDLNRSVSLLTEIQERRAADLTAEEVEALEWVAQLADRTHCERGRAVQNRALSALSKILKDGT